MHFSQHVLSPVTVHCNQHALSPVTVHHSQHAFSPILLLCTVVSTHSYLRRSNVDVRPINGKLQFWLGFSHIVQEIIREVFDIKTE